MLYRILKDFNTESKKVTTDLGYGIIQHSFIESEERKNARIEIKKLKNNEFIKEIKELIIKNSEFKKDLLYILGFLTANLRDTSILSFYKEILKIENDNSVKERILDSISNQFYLNEDYLFLLDLISKRNVSLSIKVTNTLRYFPDFSDEEYLIKLLEESKNEDLKISILNTIKSINEIKPQDKTTKFINQADKVLPFKKVYSSLDSLKNALIKNLESEVNNIGLKIKINDEFEGFINLHKQNVVFIDYGLYGTKSDKCEFIRNFCPSLNFRKIFDDIKKITDEDLKEIIMYFSEKVNLFSEFYKTTNFKSLKTDIEKLFINNVIPKDSELSIYIGLLKTKISNDNNFVQFVYDELCKNETYENEYYIYVRNKLQPTFSQLDKKP